jgi:hypothetical protein
MGSTEFEGWPKTPHWFRDIVITEKLDGTNAAVNIVPLTEVNIFQQDPSQGIIVAPTTDMAYFVMAQSRKRYVTAKDDNAGFGKWVNDNAVTLVTDLGPGRHFGEWWGQGIQRNYGLDHKRFSLFNTAKWLMPSASFTTPNLGVVPIMYEGANLDWQIEWCLDSLYMGGSWAVDGFMKPEGIVIYHTAGNKVFKVLLEGDETPKSLKVNV